MEVEPRREATFGASKRVVEAMAMGGRCRGSRRMS